MNKRCLILAAVLFSVFPLCSQDIIRKYQDGAREQAKGNYYQAIEIYKSVIKENPGYLEALTGSAYCYFAIGEYGEALSYIEQARFYDRNNLDLMNFHGRVHISLGDLPRAQELFSMVLAAEPNNKDAQFGLAEIDVVSGKLKNAAQRYTEALERSPESRKALLSLIILYQESGDYKNLEILLQQALHYHSGVSFVQYSAGTYYYKMKDYPKAEYHARLAIQIDPESIESKLLLSKIIFRQEKVQETIALLESLQKQDPEDYLVWYFSGNVYESAGNYETALRCYRKAFTLRYDDEISRIGAENLILAYLEKGDESYKPYISYHTERGRAFEKSFRLDPAGEEYRRALLLNPHDTDTRLLYAEYLRTTGYHWRYLENVEIMLKEEPDNQDLLDEKEILVNILDSGVALDWGLDQYDVGKERYRVAVFPKPSPNEMMHFGAETILTDYYTYLLNGYSNIQALETVKGTDSSRFFSMARNEKADYFLVLSYEETDRIFRVTAECYSAATSTLIETIVVTEFGNDKIFNGMRRAAKRIHDILPKRGRIIKRNEFDVVVNIGMIDDVEAGDEYLVLRDKEVSLRTKDFGFLYTDDAVLGILTIGETDEMISSGSVESTSFFDYVNPGDIIVPKPPETEEPETGDADTITEQTAREVLLETRNKELYQQLLRIPD